MSDRVQEEELERLSKENVALEEQVALLKSNLDIQNGFYNAALEKTELAEAEVKRLTFLVDHYSNSFKAHYDRAEIAEAEIKILKSAILKLNTAAIEYEEASESRLAKAQKLIEKLENDIKELNRHRGDESQLDCGFP